MQIMTSLPTGWQYKTERIQLPQPGQILWSGKKAPPEIGSKVYVRMNGLGWATVRSYAVQEGWLGLLVQIDERPDFPEWYRRQNPTNKPGLVFGVELDMEKICEAT